MPPMQEGGYFFEGLIKEIEQICEGNLVLLLMGDVSGVMEDCMDRKVLLI